MRGKDVRQDPSPTVKEDQQNGPVAGRVRGGFALRGGNMVTRKALVRPIARRSPHFGWRWKGLRQTAHRVVLAGICTTLRPVRSDRTVSSR